ncbi:O-methyltransferase [uncultured Megasphaera sp.]|uniref:O-methyltransferase n=1 Tax=uncultured Megasphaera sp. TaxID=165188 RepID=UPI0025DAC6BF|nr:O-methyltransferase [uncultured Megasphaera sp.]
MMDGLFREMKACAEAQRLPILRDSELPLFEGILASCRPKQILEIGTCIGYSALHMAPFLTDGGTITTIELDQERYEAACGFFARSPYKEVITALCGDGTELAATLPGPWDFVFLDGPKGQYVRQIRSLLPKLEKGALIVADNIRYHDMFYLKGTLPHKHRTAVTRLREFMDLVEDREHFETVFFENGDGMTVSQWKG